MKAKRNQPLYMTLVNDLKNYIQNNMEKDQKLLGERELALRLKISRYTVRQALTELEKRGYVYKIHGKGTFVSEKSAPTALNDIYSFTEQMESLGKTPKTELLNFEVFKADETLATILKVDRQDKIIKLKWLRIADDIPMMIERTYLPYKKFNTLTVKRLSEDSLYSIMKKDFNEDVHIVNEALQASIVSANDAKLLQVRRDSACLKVKRTSFNKLYEPIEYNLCTARSDQFVYNHKYIHRD